MASILCGNCKNGIRYNGSPKGIEYTYFARETWDSICSSSFDPKSNRYRYLLGIFIGPSS